MDWQQHRLSTRLDLASPLVDEVYRLLAEVDATKNVFRITRKLQPQAISRLTQSVIITSTGASNRIEGNRLSDEEVQALYRNMRIRKFRTRDEQEVAGYLKTLETVFDEYGKMPITEAMILQLHRDMLHYSEKDQRQRGQYKFGPNRVEAKDQTGEVVGVIFDPTPPHLTAIEMCELIAWYRWAEEADYKHPLIRAANFIFEFLAIHPFQDGNGRTSRLLTNLMLMQHGYDFAKLASHERLVEARKADYYLALNQTQSSWKSDDEDLSPWLVFIVSLFRDQAAEAIELLEGDRIDHLLSEKQLQVWEWINQYDGETFSRKDVIEALDMPARTVEASIKRLVDMDRLERLGQGRATRYQLKIWP